MSDCIWSSNVNIQAETYLLGSGLCDEKVDYTHFRPEENINYWIDVHETLPEIITSFLFDLKLWCLIREVLRVVTALWCEHNLTNRRDWWRLVRKLMCLLWQNFLHSAPTNSFGLHMAHNKFYLLTYLLHYTWTWKFRLHQEFIFSKTQISDKPFVRRFKSLNRLHLRQCDTEGQLLRASPWKHGILNTA